MPTGIYPLAFAQHEDFSHPAGVVDPLAAGLELIRIVGVHDRSQAINLDFGFGKLKLQKLASAFCKLGRAVKNCLAV